ncbi:MAG TPA: ankyrin repeat domain-containing protein [Verrucomicrobiae bacterium]|nr:ankyrin repeat domain-containing protein [Verrucomicrobiae bacterium]
MSKALKAAIEANDPEAVRKAVKHVKDINRKLPGARAPLLYACEKGADQVLEALFEAGAIAEKRNAFPDDTPFSVAARYEQGKVLERLYRLKQASESAVEHAMEMAAFDGRETALDSILSTVKPEISIKLFNLASRPKNAPGILRLLVKHGGDVNVRSTDPAQSGVTPLHNAASGAEIPVIKTLVECGADINGRDAIGRTPLMMLAHQLEWIERTESESACVEALNTLLQLGADASLADNYGNDAVSYCEFEYGRSRSAASEKFIKLLCDAGAPGSGATGRLFAAMRTKDLAAVRRAIEEGADVNHICPAPGESTPLMWASSEELVDILLSAGADPNKSTNDDTPLISAAGSGHLDIVKKLIAAGADIHAVKISGEFMQNAYSAAEMNRQYEVADYLKALGAGKPKPAKSTPLKPGVGSWNDFSEVLVKASVKEVAEALATMVNGKVQMSVYGQTVLPGKNAYVVVRPTGMNWCNVFQVAPPRLRFEDAEKTEKFAAELAKKCGAAVLSIEYSDTSDAASIMRVEPDGKRSQDQGWNRETLEEIVEAMGKETPTWAKQQLANTDEDEPSSTERLVLLAEQEKFVVAAFGFYCESGRKLDVEVTGYGADSFEGVAFVTN